jgi:hypothetical protein
MLHSLYRAGMLFVLASRYTIPIRMPVRRKGCYDLPKYRLVRNNYMSSILTVQVFRHFARDLNDVLRETESFSRNSEINVFSLSFSAHTTKQLLQSTQSHSPCKLSEPPLSPSQDAQSSLLRLVQPSPPRSLLERTSRTPLRR